ncbi:hypothetical protein RD792_002446 [Penstemon davidsonii]|uniref:Aspergillus nuclease S1 n=1 Tax=Penstemon davidsonii TaxID=160366 RepID=A0ABR0DRX8_9LAMI|nr:hypothetical protein RD792_002446 [Penstemon davidsonii]
MIKLFDSHCHLQDTRIYSLAPKLIQKALDTGVVHFAVNGVSEKDWHLVKEMSDSHSSIIPNFGLHPWFITERTPNWLNNLKEFLAANPSAAVGEIGIDKGSIGKRIDFSDQVEVFRLQLQLAKELKRPASVHCVRAFGDLLEILKSVGPFPAGIVLHSYLGSAEMVPEFSKLGAYFSFSGFLMSMKESKAKKMLKSVPIERILLETDAPDARPKSVDPKSLFLINESDDVEDGMSLPEESLNHPANIHHVLAYVAHLLENEEEELARISYQNAVRLFSYEGSKLLLQTEMELWWFGRLMVVMLIIPKTLGWGKEGHYIVCKIAENYLTADALAAAKALLPDSAEGDLAAVCSWPDQIRFHYRWSSPLHYIDTPDFRCNYQYCRDCHDSVGRKDRCVTGAIYNYTMQLMSEHRQSDLSVTKYNLTEALMFLSHFVGDVHQPLHVGFTGDEGGNTINVRWYRRKSNLHHVSHELLEINYILSNTIKLWFKEYKFGDLAWPLLICVALFQVVHSVWDTMIIESALKTYYNSDLTTMIQSIQSNIKDAFIGVASWKNCNGTVCPEPYASESINLACKFAYRNATPGSTLGDDYFLTRLPVVEQRLAQGGVRLAAILNSIFSAHPSLAKE